MPTIINNWKPETKSLIETLLKHNLTIVSVDNGETETNFADVSLAEFIEQTMACDEARLYVKTPRGENRWLYLVYGNSPGELVCDYTIAPEVDAATNEHYNKWEGKKQPVCASPY